MPPDPPAGSAQDRWLRGQDDTLLSILRSLLDPASCQNYLSNYESTPVLGVIILVISLAFFYLYLVYVYPISELL